MTDLTPTLLSQIVGDDHVLTDPDTLAYFATDIAGQGAHLPLCVVQPADVDETQRAIKTAIDLGVAIVPRGGGLSDNGGTQADRPDAVVIDLSRLTDIQIDVENRYVTVEAGCTWAALYDALKPHHLRTPYFGPGSGIGATVGGTASSNGSFFGEGEHGPMSESVLGLDVVLADGTLVSTGAEAAEARPPFSRHFGPDFTGLFLGDCGAFGVKVRVTLKLIEAPSAEAHASFAYERFEDLAQAQTEIAKLNCHAEQWGVDPDGNAQMARLGHSYLGAPSHLRDVSKVVDPTYESGRMLTDGHRLNVKGGIYALHVTTEGLDQADADRKLERIRKAALVLATKELPNDIPKNNRTNPFRPLKSLLGLDGENWVPVHAHFPMDRATEVAAITDEYFFRHAELMQEHGITVTHRCFAAGNSFTLQAMLYWKDSLTAFHERHVTAEQWQQFKDLPANPEAREAVQQLRSDLARLWGPFGGTHHQIGRFYDYGSVLSSASLAMAKSVKEALDPKGLMNPGALQLDYDGGTPTNKFQEFPQNLFEDTRNVI